MMLLLIRGENQIRISNIEIRKAFDSYSDFDSIFLNVEIETYQDSLSNFGIRISDF